jgi:hypothetical protein
MKHFATLGMYVALGLATFCMGWTFGFLDGTEHGIQTCMIKYEGCPNG